MNANTLTLYVIAAALSFSLSLVLVAFAYFQPGTVLVRRAAAAILVLAVAFFAAGSGPLLPRWMTVMGTNMLLLSSGVLFYRAFAGYCTQRAAITDWPGWGVVALTAIPFGYWGLIEPNGIYRSVVFSFATALINVRSATLLLRHATQQKGGWPARLLGITFAIVTLWMLSRGIILLLADEPMAPTQRGANPTHWSTVFWYIVLVSFMTAILLWMEVHRLKTNRVESGSAQTSAYASAEPAEGSLLLLWSLVAVFSLAIVSEVGIAYGALIEKERAQLQEHAMQTNDALAQHTQQVINQVDILLRAARGYYLQTDSVPATESFIASLGFDQTLIDNIYLIDAEGEILVPWRERDKGRFASHRDYFLYHQQTPEDHIFIGSVQTGQVTGKMQFRITRRINRPDGSFGGVLVAPLEPKAFSDYFQARVVDKGGVATLVGTADRKIRARTPNPDDRRWDIPLNSSVWAMLSASPKGSYRANSAVDGVDRLFNYQRVGHLPLIMVTGFSEADVRKNIVDRFQTIAFGAFLVLLTIITLAAILMMSIRRREEQGHFMSMLSHELKTPLSVIRMALGSQAIPDSIKARINRNVSEMNAIVERCVQADRLNHGLVTSTRQTCNINTLLEELKQSAATPERVSIMAVDLPPCKTDVQLIHVILNNLLDNAHKYGAANSPIEITANEFSRQGKPGICIVVANRAGSAGMPDPRQIFRKYYRAPGAHGKTGSGLGLHIAAGFARKISGELRYTPEANTVRFELWIPH